MSIGMFYANDHYYFVRAARRGDAVFIDDVIVLSEPINLKKRFRQKKVCAAIHALSVLHQEAMFDAALSERDVQQSVQQNQSEHFPFVTEPLNIQMTKRSARFEDEECYDIFAIRKQEYQKIHHFVRSANLKLSWLEPEMQARARIKNNSVRYLTDIDDHFLPALGSALRGFNVRD